MTTAQVVYNHHIWEVFCLISKEKASKNENINKLIVGKKFRRYFRTNEGSAAGYPFIITG